MFFRFPPDARWNPQRSVVEFGIGGGEYEGVVRVSRRVFQLLLSEKPTPERFLEAYHLNRTRLELVAEQKVRHRQLTDDGNVEITGRDLREGDAAAQHAGSGPIGLPDEGSATRDAKAGSPCWTGSQSRLRPWQSARIY